jgi:hypothetical protein
MVRYNEALTKRETGMNDVHEESLCARFPPAERMLLTRPSVILDSGHRIIIWYIPEALHGYIQVGTSFNCMLPIYHTDVNRVICTQPLSE